MATFLLDPNKRQRNFFSQLFLNPQYRTSETAMGCGFTLPGKGRNH
jgi:hypothetical protein